MYRTTYLLNEQRVAEDEMLIRASVIFHRYGVKLRFNDITSVALSDNEVQAERIFRHISSVDQDVFVEDSRISDCVAICVNAYNAYSLLMAFADSVGDTMAQWDYDRGRTPMSSWPKDRTDSPASSLDVYARSQPEFKAAVRLVANTFLNDCSRIGTLHTLSAHDRSLGKSRVFTTEVENLCRWIDLAMWSYEGDQPIPN